MDRGTRTTLFLASIASVLLIASCGSPAKAPGPVATVATSRAASAPIPALVGDGVTLAQNAGATLIVLSLDPGGVGANTVRVDLRDAMGAVADGHVRLDLSLDGAPAGTTTVAQGTPAALTIPRAGHARVAIAVVDGGARGATVAFAVDLPVEHVAGDLLAQVDAATAALHTEREAETLTSGGPVLLYHFEYQAPDHVRYTTITPTGLPMETRLIGRDRFDREGDGAWTTTDLGFPTKVPYSAYAPKATRVRIVGHDRVAGQDLLGIAFVQGGDVFYTIWVGAQDHLVRRYVMMAKGHYMTGTYSDFDAPLTISAP